MEYYLATEKGYKSDMFYNMETSKHYAKRKQNKTKQNRRRRPHIALFHIYEISKMGKSTET